MTDRSRILVIMAKAPRLGAGKTRLARETGAAQAWRVNRWLHRVTMRAAHDRRWRTIIAVAPRSTVALRLPGVWPPALDRVAQGAGDLGVRMRRVLRRLPGHVAVIGADCPEMTRADIAAAFRALAGRAAAIGPSPDGGFWIAAARRAAILDRAFRNVPWSSPSTCAAVCAQLPPHVRLRVLHDIDTLEDLRAVRARSSRARRYA